MDGRRRLRPAAGDRATLAATGLSVAAAPGLAAAAGVVETLFAPTAMAMVAAVALSRGSVALGRGRNPVVATLDARVWLAAALLVDVELVARLVSDAGAGLGVVYAAASTAVDGADAPVAAAAALDAGFAAFCLALGVALVAVHDAALGRAAARGRTHRCRGGRVDERRR